MSRLSLRIWTATGVMVLSFAVYESAKTVLFPRMSLIQSHVMTVSVVGLCSFLISRYTLGRYNAAVKEIDEQANAINEANRLFSSVFANLREGVILVNSRKDVVLYNAAAAGMLNLSRSSEGGPSRSGPPPGFAGLHPGITKPAAGQPALRLVHATRNPTVNEAFRRALEDGATSDDRVEFFSHELKSYQVSVAPLSQGLAVGVFFDITELERLEKVRREFFSNLSHELRTPLTAILALAETLLNGAIDDQENN
ncbi:MAG TPA: histidine kinase dimerization/phospho-acceptor domain-containing protein, partial [Blastocatellia bacterium]|nr:histidine kinase dimerization/phospho-acceptor domain-containing protein [Blastocatellia bacterium]